MIYKWKFDTIGVPVYEWWDALPMMLGHHIVYGVNIFYLNQMTTESKPTTQYIPLLLSEYTE